MKRFYRFAAMGFAGLMTLFTLAPAGLAVSSTVPNSNITGSPAHWIPSTLTAKATLNPGGFCTPTYYSFTMTNKEKVTEKYAISGTNGYPSSHGSIPPKVLRGICVFTPFKGDVITVKLSDGKKLKVTVT